MKTTKFSNTISTDRYFGSTRVTRKIYICMEDHPTADNSMFEELDVEDVTKLRDMCNEILELVKNEDEREESKARKAADAGK